MIPDADHPSAPIGIFDSGMGGLSVYREVRKALPDESLAYVADSAHVPYGDKPPARIRERSELLARFLIRDAGAKAVVIACNTATAFAVRPIRERFSVPVVALEPALKPAAAATRSAVVGVLATAGTLHSQQFERLVKSFGREIRLVTVPGHGLVEQVERGKLDGVTTASILEKHLAPMMAAGADVVVLGSTHYVFLRPLIQQIVGPSVAVLDSGEAVARQLRRVLESQSLLATPSGPVHESFWTSGDPESVSQVASRLLARDVRMQRLPDGY